MSLLANIGAALFFVAPLGHALLYKAKLRSHRVQFVASTIYIIISAGLLMVAGVVVEGHESICGPAVVDVVQLAVAGAAFGAIGFADVFVATREVWEKIIAK